MISFWIVLIHLMADVMSHGGDGAGDPPISPFGGPESHQLDGSPSQKRRGKAKNKKLQHELEKKGGPLSLPFDRAATYSPVGELNDMFVREVGIYMEANYPFNVRSWTDLSDAQKNALDEHTARRFDFDEILRDRERAQIEGGIRSVYLKRFRDRKNVAKRHFDRVGGYEDVEQARLNPPRGMNHENWSKTIDFFLSDGHRKASSSNKANRQQQQYTNRGGTASYSSYCYKQNKSRLEAFQNAHTSKDGTFDTEIAEQKYNQLKGRFDELSQSQNEGNSSSLNEVEVFESVLGERRGHIRGIGRKPSSSAGSTSFVPDQEQTPQTLSEAQIASLFQNANFMSQMTQLIDSQKDTQQVDEDDDSDDDNE